MVYGSTAALPRPPLQDIYRSNYTTSPLAMQAHVTDCPLDAGIHFMQRVRD